MMVNKIIYPTAIGKLLIGENGKSITHLEFYNDLGADLAPPSKFIETPLLKKAAAQLDEYFAGQRSCFDLPLEPAGTDFQKSIWQALLAIPFGQTRSYKDIAEAVGCPKGYRAVGLANNKNPIAIIIPCHRVIGANGKLVGYAGGLGRKETLLRLEKAIF